MFLHLIFTLINDPRTMSFLKVSFDESAIRYRSDNGR